MIIIIIIVVFNIRDGSGNHAARGTQLLGPYAQDLIARNAALSACAEAMQWPRCLALLAEAADGADGVSCNAVLKAFEKSRRDSLGGFVSWDSKTGPPKKGINTASPPPA